MEFNQAHQIALQVLAELRPHCYRAEIAGSIRREKPEVKDIEIVAIVKPFKTGLFESGIATVVNKWQKVKGEMDMSCKYTQRILPSGIKLDLFLCQPDNWGNIFFTRTGSAEYSKKVAGIWVSKGYHSIDGYLCRNNKKVFLYEELELFKLLGIQFITPKERI